MNKQKMSWQTESRVRVQRTAAETARRLTYIDELVSQFEAGLISDVELFNAI